MSDAYVDPENRDEIFERLKNLKTMEQVRDLVREVFPTWIVTFIYNYSPDYPQLYRNWKKICSMTKSSPTQVMIVDDYINDDRHYLVNTFAEGFTRAGFSVRKKSEYIPCEGCGFAIPVYNLWKMMKEKGMDVPEEWKAKCNRC